MMFYTTRDAREREREMIQILTEVRVLQQEQNKKLDRIMLDQEAVEKLFHGVDDRVQLVEIKMKALQESYEWMQKVGTSILVAVVLFFGSQVYSIIKESPKDVSVSTPQTK